MTRFRLSLVIIFNSINKDAYTYYCRAESLQVQYPHKPFHLVVDISSKSSLIYFYRILLLIWGLTLVKLRLVEEIILPHLNFKFSSIIPRSYFSKIIILDDGLDTFRAIPLNLDKELIVNCKYFVRSSMLRSLPLKIPSWYVPFKIYPEEPTPSVSLLSCEIPSFFYSHSNCIVESRSIDIALDLYAKIFGPLSPSKSIVIRHPNPSKRSISLGLDYQCITYPISHIDVLSLPCANIIFGASVLPFSLLSYLCRYPRYNEPQGSLIRMTYLLERNCISSFHALLSICPPYLDNNVLFSNDEYLLIQSSVISKMSSRLS